MRLLIAGPGGFLAENREVLRAGLQSAAWITVDDTGARHAGGNGYCTRIGNDAFPWFGTTPGKSRMNFLALLRAGHTDYVVNAAALAYRRPRSLAGPVMPASPSMPTSGSPMRQPGRRISNGSGLRRCMSPRTRGRSPPRGRWGAASRRTGFCP